MVLYAFLTKSQLYKKEIKILTHGVKEQGNAKNTVTADKLKEIYGDSVFLAKEHNYEEISFKD